MTKKIAVTTEMEYLGNPQMMRSFINHDYAHFVMEAGAFPVTVTCDMDVDMIADTCDGLLLTGGKDIHPLLYGHDLEYNGAQKCNLVRDIFERDLYRAFLSRAKPIFGICRGFQMICIMSGFVLIQDINKYKDVSIAHSQSGPEITGDNPVHIMVNRGIIRSLTGKENLPVNSFHHQGFFVQGKTGKAAWLQQSENVLGWSRSRDKAKVLEAVALWLPSEEGGDKDTAVCGVQYHPERMMRRKKDKMRHLSLFKWTMGLCNNPNGYEHVQCAANAPHLPAELTPTPLIKI